MGNNKTIILIFSKDRALQLDATLRSLILHCKDVDETEIRILYKVSEQKFVKDYNLLKSNYNHLENLKFIEEESFKNDLVKAISNFEYVLFLVDDNVFVNNFETKKIIKKLEENNNILGCSLRLGKNTVHCYPYDKYQNLPEFEIDGDFLRFNWRASDLDFNYSIEVSSSIYKTSLLLDYIKIGNISNPNSLESFFEEQKNTIAKNKDELICYNSSRTFCVPLNKVQDTCNNRDSGKVEYSVDEFSAIFCSGKRINVEALIGYLPKGCHEEITLEYIDFYHSDNKSIPNVSVVIPLYNQEQFIKEAIESVITQNYKDWQLIIVDDGSTDNSKNVCLEYFRKYNDLDINIISKPNNGLSAARNTGLLYAKGKYILPLDSDDRLFNYTLEKYVKTIIEKDVDLVYADYKTFESTNENIKCIDLKTFYDPWRDLNGLPYNTFYKKGVWEKNGGYSTNMIWGYEDWDYWLSTIKNKFRAFHLEENMFEYRVRAESMLANSVKYDTILRMQMSLNNIDLYGEVYKKGFLNLISENPLISVIMPTYNRPDLLENAIKSVLNQTFGIFEIVVVNDCGKDSKFVVEKFNDPRIKYFVHEKNKGLAAARNTGIKNSKGKYIAYLDDDDIYYANHLETLVKKIKDNKIDVVYSDANRVTHKINNSSYNVTERVVKYSEDFDYNKILCDNFIPVLCIMHAKSCFEKAGYFDESLDCLEDWDLWIRISREYKFYHIKKVTCEFSWREDGSTMSSSMDIQFIKNKGILFNKYVKHFKNNNILQIEYEKYFIWKTNAENRINRKTRINDFVKTLKSDLPEVSIIIPVYNKFEFTLKCINAIINNTNSQIPYEIIIVDNASSDDTQSYFNSIDNPSLVYIRNQSNLGFSKANNIGAKAAKGNYLIFLNNDTEVQNDWLEPLIDTLLTNEKIGIVGAKLVYPNGQIQHCGKVWGENFNDKISPKHLYLGIDHNTYFTNKSREFTMVTGACIGVRKNEFIEYGLFDESYKNGWEDDDLCYTYSDKCKKIYYCSECLVVHHENITLKENFNNSDFEYNQQRFFSKWKNKIKRDDIKYFTDDGLKLVKKKNEKFLSFEYFGGKNIGAESVNIVNLVRGGDIFLSTALLPEISKIHKTAKITFTCAPIFKEILKNNPYIDQINCIGRNDYNENDWYIAQKESEKYDESYFIQPIPDLGNSFFTELRNGNWHLLDIFSSKTGVYHNNNKPEMFFEEDEIEKTKNKISKFDINFNEEIIVCHIDAKDNIKSWSINHFVELTEMIKADYPSLQIILIGGDESSNYSHTNFTNLSGKLTIRESAILISKSNYFVGVDSLPSHLTAINETNALILFGSTFPELCGPSNKNYKYIQESNANNISSKQVYKKLKTEIFQEEIITPSDNVIQVSIIIPVFNLLELTKKCLDSIYANTSEKILYEIIVVDNGSEIEMKKFLDAYKKSHKNFNVVTNKENIGFAKANNLAAKFAKGKYLLLLNNDTEVLPNWLNSLISIIDNDEKVAAVGSKLLFPDRTIQHAGVVIVRDENYSRNIIARHIFQLEPETSQNVNRKMIFQALTAACLLVRKSCFEEVNGFDDNYWNGYEDVDLCFQLLKNDYLLVYQPESVVIHHESKSGKQRFVKTDLNVKRLHEKWSDKILPDYVIKKNNDLESDIASYIRTYIPNKKCNRKLSIIVPVYNNWEYTEQFLNNLIKDSGNYEIIIIDNNSTDNTSIGLEIINDKFKNLIVIKNSENLGFPKAVNQGITEATGDILLIANNDIIISNYSIEKLVKIAFSYNNIGIVSGISNYVSGVQLDKNANYNTIEEMFDYAQQTAISNKDEFVEFPRVAFLCTLIKREVIEKIGGLDERFSPGNYEDDDYCLRAQLAGYKTIIAKDVFIHHYGSKSFKADGNNKYDELLKINERIFVDKWGNNPDDIWLNNKEVKKRELYYPINKNKIEQYFSRGFIQIKEEEFDLAKDSLEKCLKEFDTLKQNKIGDISRTKVQELLTKIEKVIQVEIK